MQFEAGDIFHVYNRGNNKQQIFFSEGNYIFFLEKVKQFIHPVSNILAYCLMPNHFHFLVQANETSCKPRQLGSLSSTELNNGFRLLQSSYTKAINKNKGFTGSLFQQKAKFKLLSWSDNPRHDHLSTCLHYIHQNPVKANLVSRMEDWKYSSFNEYISGARDGLCRTTFSDTINIPERNFYEMSSAELDDKIVQRIF